MSLYVDLFEAMYFTFVIVSTVIKQGNKYRTSDPMTQPPFI